MSLGHSQCVLGAGSTTGSTAGSTGAPDLVLGVVCRAASVPPLASHLVTHAGLIPWLSLTASHNIGLASQQALAPPAAAAAAAGGKALPPHLTHPNLPSASAASAASQQNGVGGAAGRALMALEALELLILRGTCLPPARPSSSGANRSHTHGQGQVGQAGLAYAEACHQLLHALSSGAGVGVHEGVDVSQPGAAVTAASAVTCAVLRVVGALVQQLRGRGLALGQGGEAGLVRGGLARLAAILPAGSTAAAWCAALVQALS